MTDMIRLAIIEDNEAYRKSLQALVGKANDIELVYSGATCHHIVEAVDIIAPDVVIMDIDLPEINGIEGVRLLKQKHPNLNVFMLTVFEDEDKIFESIKAGAVGYLLKKDPPDSIIEAIGKVARGESVMNGKIARKILAFFALKEQKEQAMLDDYHLTRREKEILQLLMNGDTYKQIAATCFVSLDTVFSHVRKIYAKLNVHSRAEIAARFRQG